MTPSGYNFLSAVIDTAKNPVPYVLKNGARLYRNDKNLKMALKSVGFKIDKGEANDYYLVLDNAEVIPLTVKYVDLEDVEYFDLSGYMY